MAWKATGQPTVRKQRDKWVVRVDGIDTATGKHRPKQVGTYLSQRSAQAAARRIRSESVSIERGTVGWLVHRWVASKTNITVKARQQYEWAAGHIDAGIGVIPLNRLDRDDVALWIENLAAGGKLGRRGIQICRTECLRQPIHAKYLSLGYPLLKVAKGRQPKDATGVRDIT